MTDIAAPPYLQHLFALLVALAIAALALALRVLVHVGVTPSGVDTWYYLASADELRRTRRLPISLPQYLLHDRTESYPPGFIVLLSALPQKLVRRHFWLISPAIDAIHLLFLYLITYRLTNSIVTTAIGALIYAVVPQLIAETRSLNPRALGALLASIAMFAVFRAVLPETAATELLLGPSPWMVVAAAVLLIAILFLSHTTVAIAFSFSTLLFSLVFMDWRYVGFTIAGFATAFLISGGFYARVLMNHVHALRFWRRNLRYRDAEPILDSPLYGHESGSPRKRPRRWRSLRWQAVRLVGENPFVIPMLLIPVPALAFWGQHMYWWAIGVIGWAAATTFVPPLRVFGPGYLYLKASVFPTAIALALAVGGPEPPAPRVAVLVAGAGLVSLAALAFFYVFTRTRKTELTSSLPRGLAEVTSDLAGLPGEGVLVLPTMYADYVCYNARKQTLWGGHSGDLSRFEAIAPVVRRPFDELIEKYGLRYVLLDLSYVTPEQIRLAERLSPLRSAESFVLYQVSSSPAGRGSS